MIVERPHMVYAIAFHLTRLALLLSIASGTVAATALAAESAKTAPEKSVAKRVQPTHRTAPAKKTVAVKNATPGDAAIATLANQARAAYWHGDIAGAIAEYQTLVREHPQPRWYGELGNIYLQTGRPHQAAEAYYHAARALIAAGRPLEAGALLPTLQRLDPPLAARLLARETQHKETH